MNRFMEKIVFCGLVTACRLATCPTSRSPSFVKATTDGVVRPPSALGMTTGSPPSMTATTELVVPRSIPTVFGISNYSLRLRLRRAFPRRPDELGAIYPPEFDPKRLTHLLSNQRDDSRTTRKIAGGMRTGIVGCGRVGSNLARQLSRKGDEVAAVDFSEAAFNRLGEDFVGEMVFGTGVDEDVLRRAGTAQADAFVAVTNADTTNIIAAQLATSPSALT